MKIYFNLYTIQNKIVSVFYIPTFSYSYANYSHLKAEHLVYYTYEVCRKLCTYRINFITLTKKSGGAIYAPRYKI